MSAVVPAATGLQQGQLGTDEEREHGAAPRGSAGRHGDAPRRGGRDQVAEIVYYTEYLGFVF